jgi:hypothetical protein
MVEDYKELHVRLTHIDCINAQNNLMKLMQKKIKNNSALSMQEEYNFSALVSNALLSMGQGQIYYITKDSTEVPLGSLHSMLLRMVGIRGKSITLKYFNKKYTVSMSNIWLTLKNECIKSFPSALQEAIHISREMPKREEPSEYVFGKDREL